MKNETTTVKDMFIKSLNDKGFNMRKYNQYIYFGTDRFIKVIFTNIDNINISIHITIELQDDVIMLRLLSDDITKIEALLVTSLSIK